MSLFAGIVRRLSAHPRADDGKFPILLAVFPVADYYPLKQAALVHNPIAYIPAPSSVSGAGVTLVMQLTNPVVRPRETRADWLCETVLAGQHPVLADCVGLVACGSTPRLPSGDQHVLSGEAAQPAPRDAPEVFNR